MDVDATATASSSQKGANEVMSTKKNFVTVCGKGDTDDHGYVCLSGPPTLTDATVARYKTMEDTVGTGKHAIYDHSLFMPSTDVLVFKHPQTGDVVWATQLGVHNKAARSKKSDWVVQHLTLHTWARMQWLRDAWNALSKEERDAATGKTKLLGLELGPLVKELAGGVPRKRASSSSGARSKRQRTASQQDSDSDSDSDSDDEPVVAQPKRDKKASRSSKDAAAVQPPPAAKIDDELPLTCEDLGQMALPPVSLTDVISIDDFVLGFARRMLAPTAKTTLVGAIRAEVEALREQYKPRTPAEWQQLFIDDTPVPLKAVSGFMSHLVMTTIAKCQERMKAAHDRAQLCIQRADERSEDIEKGMDELQAEVIAADRRKAEAEAQLKVANDKLQQSIGTATRQTKEIDVLTAAVQKEQARIKELEAVGEAQTATINKYANDEEALTKKILELNAQLKELKKPAPEIAELKTQLDAKGSEIAALQAELAAANKKIADAERRSAASELAIRSASAMQAEKTRLEEDAASAALELAKLRDALQAEQQQRQAADAQIDDYKQRLEKANTSAAAPALQKAKARKRKQAVDDDSDDNSDEEAPVAPKPKLNGAASGGHKLPVKRTTAASSALAMADLSVFKD